MSLAPFGFGSRILDPVSSSDLWDLRFLSIVPFRLGRGSSIPCHLR
ncbi:18.1 kDa class I heat shock protein-like isoform X1 [Iris pallida]|uniref:18.1 kDa class I heat shock protein-like isoform X1 n=1 Tax=Iris pallida TaxID=29817 RepID=A0AAX6GK42_IRIPA|nr:18.1 kDa class I heat shock protein-like isoform X1 [Iris pallida]